MAKGVMVNFRVDKDAIERFDEAAMAAGMSRSAWLRNAAELALGRYTDAGFVPKANPVPRKDTRPKCAEGNYRSCNIADWRNLPNGIKACSVCNVRVSR